ncbi:cytochrome P450 93B2 [Populus alba]|uniref:Licodione synthase-like n=1 Tax=Populus alba x Populus x berolinensis TaxID=444605 RepID=A0AAD6LW45_9ROSI|nr:licodione synthase-like [Populus alba]KAJ6974415.1 licodione synthase-like [Populus alba x Populus x berolinensis]
MMFELVIAGFAILLVTVFILTNKGHGSLPPGPMPLPIIGHLHLLQPLIHRSFRDFCSCYGPLIYLRLGSVPCVVASTPELARELLKTNDLTFSSRKHSLAIDHLTYSSSFAFAPYGPYWRFIKKLSTFEFLGNRALNQFLPVRRKELRQFIGVLHDKSKVCESVNVTKELLNLSSNIISQIILSLRCSGTDNEAEGVRTLVREVTQIFGEFNVSDFIWFCRNLDFQGYRKKFEDVHRRYDALLENIITNREIERKKSGGKYKVKDLLDMMLDALEDKSSEVELTREHIKALVLDFITAATDTTAAATEWALAELINNPKVLEKARQEVDTVVGNKRLVEESDSPNLPYIQAIIKETFRLHPPIPMIARKSIQESKINGYTIPKNTLLFVNIWSIGRDSRYWKNPLEFEPERFLKSEGDTVQSTASMDIKGQHYELLPFGTGRRSCPGIALALLELPVTLAAMIQCFDWKVADLDGVKVKGNALVDMTERPGLTAPRFHDLVCAPEPRPALDSFQP